MELSDYVKGRKSIADNLGSYKLVTPPTEDYGPLPEGYEEYPVTDEEKRNFAKGTQEKTQGTQEKQTTFK